ncbi:hypothetical protein [Acinetobacter bereziniae]|uniref:hypothetical protein n=1 Tax=Acinetobacter bereziniae TaxID=106648 RepID=UPI0035712DBD
MKKNTLKEKLNNSIWKVLYASILFFIIGAILKSDGPKLDVNKIYELTKDTLSFFAAFVGPVIAYVLFNDWRGEHVEKKLEADSESIFKNINEIYLKLFEVRMSICKEITLEENEGLRINMIMELLTIELMRIRNFINLLKEEKQETLSFIELSKAIVKSLDEVNNEFYDIQNAFVRHHILKKPYDYLGPIHGTTEKLKSNSTDIDDLNIICKNLQVKQDV